MTWEGGGPSVVEPDLDTGIIETDVTAPSDASPGTYTVTATCSLDASITASATFTVLTGSENPGGTTEYYPAVELDPAEGPAGTSPVSVAGSEFNCLGVDLLWDGEPLDAAAATDGGEFATQVAVPTDAAEGQYTVRAQCAADPGTGAEATFTVTGAGEVPGTVTEPGVTDPGDTDPGITDPGDTDPGITDPGDTDPGITDPDDTDPGDTNPDGRNPPTTTTATPVGWVVGPSAVGVLLLAALGFGLLRHGHRGPRWVHEHISARLRPAAGSADVAEPPDPGPATHTVRLEPHPDNAGVQSIEEEPR
ncbi:hypothetical protein [Streptomyces sp. NBC_00239]|uniref:hypothetical protein n=1 Tax=Streptomyces sp. NBC_00239 TaxID=2903640 RepID=UPI002E29DCCE|nr:hypothetical protein [Streptomyces sp. NBC_00239]